MNVRDKPCTHDARLREVFDAPVADLYEQAGGPDAPEALTRALELRGFLALAEEQVTRVRDRVHGAMAPERDMNDLSAEDLRFDAQWLEAALSARDGYRTALENLLRTPPPPHQPVRPSRFVQHTVTTPLSSTAPTPGRTGTPRPRRG
ncbi:hypothetical protein [Streptomyces sp. ST2-7A]|uniref:hypothetical protein n=1 Tax=Streptomyces sp. ST2-7A TaxID=2907214 RepID=UPI001F17CF4E|nr:hypothetical protein [Streptomyces sp. ST2-7A]MCE7081707.1 hypothetical protein [Streptomyces sp. ST2-7A]